MTAVGGCADEASAGEQVYEAMKGKFGPHSLCMGEGRIARRSARSNWGCAVNLQLCLESSKTIYYSQKNYVEFWITTTVF